MTRSRPLELVVIGGGLAGLLACARAEAMGASPALVDAGVPGTAGALGGFAPFSGAKFSLAPAGSGLAPILGGEKELVERYRAMCSRFVDLGFAQFRVGEAELRGGETPMPGGLAFRQYHSIVLTPEEVDSLLAALAASLKRTRIIRSSVTTLVVGESQTLGAVLENGEALEARALVVAAGRLGAELLSAAGVPEGPGKGIDVGVRLAFAGREPLAGLRALGPDAKFMADGVRTFCLNSPGRIFHYPGLGYQLPGGIVAAADWPQTNVGVLCRLDDRQSVLARLAAARPQGDPQAMMLRGRGEDLGWTAQARGILGPRVIGMVDRFVAKLATSGLVELPDGFDVHYPLLDWHWPVFSLPGRLGTAVPRVVAAGDASGHARGLMQAAVMGVMAAEEALS